MTLPPNGSPPERLCGWTGLLIAGTLLLSFPASSSAGIAPVADLGSLQPNANFSVGQPSAELAIRNLQSDPSNFSQMALPDPTVRQAADQSLPELSIPNLPSDMISADEVTSKGSANAIPIPPAIQSGLTGIVALGLGAGLRRLRRALR